MSSSAKPPQALKMSSLPKMSSFSHQARPPNCAASPCGRPILRLLKNVVSHSQVPLPISGVVHLVQCYGVLMPSRGHPFKPAAVYNVPVAMFACNAPAVPPMPKIVHRSPKPVTPKVAVTPPTSASDSILAFDNEEAVGVEAQLCQAQRLECWTRSPLLPRPTRPKHARKI
jgi:lipoprotein-anchoring transpeptidase ErfK/SrfK